MEVCQVVSGVKACLHEPTEEKANEVVDPRGYVTSDDGREDVADVCKQLIENKQLLIQYRH